jgi:hypothetical protein
MLSFCLFFQNIRLTDSGINTSMEYHLINNRGTMPKEGLFSNRARKIAYPWGKKVKKKICISCLNKINFRWIEKLKVSCVLWCTLVIPVLGRLRQED